MRLMSRFQFWRCSGFFLVGLFAAAAIRVREGMMGNVPFVAADCQRALLHWVTGLQTSEAKILVFVELSSVGGAQLAINGAFLQLVHGVALGAVTWRRLCCWRCHTLLFCRHTRRHRGHFCVCA